MKNRPLKLATSRLIVHWMAIEMNGPSLITIYSSNLPISNFTTFMVENLALLQVVPIPSRHDDCKMNVVSVSSPCARDGGQQRQRSNKVGLGGNKQESRDNAAT